MHRGLKMETKKKYTVEGQDIREGIKGWIKEEIQKGPFKEFELGKFFFLLLLEQ